MTDETKAGLPAPAPAAAVPARPFAEMSQGERMSHNADLALDFTRQLLEQSFDLENPKLLALQTTVAMTIISQSIRIAAIERAPGPRDAAERERIVAEFGEAMRNG